MLITLGEPAGIGPDVVLGAFLRRPELFSDAVIVAPKSWLELRAQALGWQVPIEEVSSPHARASTPALRCWWPLAAPDQAPMAGRPSARLAQAVIDALALAANTAMQQGRPLVTAPIEKRVLIEQGWPYAGHTEMLAAVAGKRRVVMMLACKPLAVALVTTHMALRKAIEALSIDAVVQTARIVHRELVRFGLAHPRLVLCALNPHAGEGGAFGDEEQTILKPALRRLKQEGIAVEGPWPADSAFAPAKRAVTDAYLCLYHDQGLIPIKALCFSQAVNLTLGLGFVRTSPDHGTALPLAGTGKADAGGMIAAIKAAKVLANGRWPWANDSADDS